MILILSAIILFICYIFFYEPYHPAVNYHKIGHKHKQIRIVQFSDTHLGFFYSLKQFEKIIQLINDQNPDIVLFTGDLINHSETYPYNEKISEMLKQIKGKKYAVYGNHDLFDNYDLIIQNGNFSLLKNQFDLIQFDDFKLLISGMADTLYDQPAYEMEFPSHDYHIMMKHEPDSCERIKHPGNLILSGHSHGGQFNLPFLKPFILPPFAKQYYKGFYHHDKFTLYVSNGIGMARLPFRFLSKPAIEVFDLTF